MVALTQPTMIYEVAFASNPLDASPAWTDVTKFTQTCRTKRGRNHELGKIEAGTASVELLNIDRRFDPSNTSSPHSPNVKPMKPIRVRATYNGTTYGVFYGFVEGWPLTWDDPVSSVSHVRAVDGFKVLAYKHPLDTTSYPAAVNVDTPLIYDRCGSSATFGQTTGSVTFNVDGGLPADTNGGLDLGSYQGGISYPSYTFLETEMWVYPRSYSNGTTPGVLMAYSGGTAVSLDNTTLQAALTLNQWHHVFINGGGVTVDGVALGAVTTTGADPTYLVIGLNGAHAPSFDGIVDEIALYTNGSGPNSTRRQAHIDAAKFGANQATGARIGAYLDAVSWPAGLRALDAGANSVRPAKPGLFRRAALAEVLAVSDSEGYPAVSFVDRSGNFAFKARNTTYPASVATFGDGAGENRYQLAGTQVTIDDLDIYNEVTAQREGGVTQVSTNTASQTSYGIRSLTITGLLNTDDTQVAGIAAVAGAQYATPTIRLPAIKIHPIDDPTNLYPIVLASDIGTRVTVKRTAFVSGPAFSQDFIVEGVSHDITADDWWTTWQLAPVPPPFLVLDDTSFGKMDSTNVLA